MQCNATVILPEALSQILGWLRLVICACLNVYVFQLMRNRLWWLGTEGDVASPKKKKRQKHQDAQHLPNGAVHHQAAPDTGRQSSGRTNTAPTSANGASAHHAQPNSNNVQAEAATADEPFAGQYVYQQIQVEVVACTKFQ